MFPSILPLFKTFIRILTGVVFLISALSKFNSIDNVEMYVYSMGPFNLKTTVILIRLLISFELFIGIALILHLYAKKIWFLTLFSLLGFSVFLIIQIIIGDKGNCHCFGELIKMNPVQSLGKNLGLIAILFIIKNQKGITFRFQKIIITAILIGTIAFPLIAAPPDFVIEDRYKGFANLKGGYSNEAFINFLNEHTLNQDKQIVCFFSMGCKFCKLASQKLSSMARNTDDRINITYVFFGKRSRLYSFWENNNSTKYTSYILTSEEFFEISNGTLPLIVFLDNGNIKGKYSYRDLNEKDFYKFLND